MWWSKKKKREAVVAVTQRVNPINWGRQLQDEFGYGTLSNFQIMGFGGNYHKTEVKVSIYRWPVDEDGNAICDREGRPVVGFKPTQIHGHGCTAEEAILHLKTKLRLLA